MITKITPEIKNEIQKILQRAHKESEANIESSILILEEAKLLLPNFPKNSEYHDIYFDSKLKYESYILTRANILYVIGECEEALKLFNLLQQNIQNNRLCKNQGDCYFKLGKYEDALDKYKIALKLSEESKFVNNDTADIYNSLGV